MRPANPRFARPFGFSLLEMLAVVGILGIVALVVIPRLSYPAVEAKRNGCFTYKGNIEVQCQLWLRQKGTAPASNLSNIGTDKSYFPEGVLKCPVDGTSYSIDTTSLRVTGHTH